MNAVIYARYSSDNQREESIEGQLRECKEFAEKKGLTIINSYIDRALSAKTDNRPEFKQMIKDSSKRKFDVIIVWKLDRFARNRYDSAHYKSQLKKNGVKVISATESISDDATGILLESMLEGYAEFYSAELSEKVIRGMTENALKCKFNGGGMTFGYRIDDEQMFQLDPVTAPIVLEIFQKYADGETINSIKNYLENIGVRNSRGGNFSLDAVKLALKNRRYLGEYSYRDVVVPNGIPAIVSLELFEKVQARMEKNRKAPARHKAKADLYLLTTKLCCGKCGAFMVGESGTSRNGTFHQYYKCANVKNKKGCDKKTVRKKFIEDAVISETAKLLMNDKFIENLVEIIYEHHGKESTIIPQIKKQLAENSKAIDNILNAMEQGIITSSTKERLEKLEQSRSNLEISLAKEQMKKPEINKNQLKYWLLQFRKLDLEVPEQRQILVDNFVNAIYLYDDKIVLTFNYKGDTATVTLDEIKCSDIGELTAPILLRNLDTIVSRLFLCPKQLKNTYSTLFLDFA